MKQSEKSVAISAAKSGMCEKTARKYIKSDALPSQLKKDREWRTREDPFTDVWDQLESFLELDGSVQSKTLFDYICRERPGEFSEGQLRTLQRKVKNWRAIHGPSKEVMFPQVHHPGVMGQSDFTHMNKLGVTIQGEPFEHMFYHFVLTYSNWEWGSVCFSESFESLSSGLQTALWRLGGSPVEHRTDSLSAAVNNLRDRKEFTDNYKSLLSHYRMKGSHNNPGLGHENGDVEQSHHRLKTSVKQELILRGGSDFASRGEYERFLTEILIRRNEGRKDKFAEESGLLKELPTNRTNDFTETNCKVSRFSTITVKKNTYSVDSRLIGEWVSARIHADKIEVRYGDRTVEELPRVNGSGKHEVNYRHIIGSLVKKSGAFANYKYQSDMFPRFTFRLAYDWLRKNSPANADKDYVKILYSAAQFGEEKVDQALRSLIKDGSNITPSGVEKRALEGGVEESLTVKIPDTNVKVYDTLLQEVS